jgi:hypothetical protein
MKREQLRIGRRITRQFQRGTLGHREGQRGGGRGRNRGSGLRRCKQRWSRRPGAHRIRCCCGRRRRGCRCCGSDHGRNRSRRGRTHSEDGCSSGGRSSLGIGRELGRRCCRVSAIHRRVKSRHRPEHRLCQRQETAAQNLLQLRFPFRRAVFFPRGHFLDEFPHLHERIRSVANYRRHPTAHGIRGRGSGGGRHEEDGQGMEERGKRRMQRGQRTQEANGEEGTLHTQWHAKHAGQGHQQTRKQTRSEQRVSKSTVRVFSFLLSAARAPCCPRHVFLFLLCACGAGVRCRLPEPRLVCWQYGPWAVRVCESVQPQCIAARHYALWFAWARVIPTQQRPPCLAACPLPSRLIRSIPTVRRKTKGSAPTKSRKISTEPSARTRGANRVLRTTTLEARLGLMCAPSLSPPLLSLCELAAPASRRTARKRNSLRGSAKITCGHPSVGEDAWKGTRAVSWERQQCGHR